MAVALILDFAGGTSEQYHDVVRRMKMDRMADGGMFHAAGRYNDGLRVIDVWESMEKFDRFREVQLMDAVAAGGLDMPTVRMIDVLEQKIGSGETPTFAQIVFIPGMTREAFVAMDAEILPGGRIPESLTWHVNGTTEGGYCVADAWRDKSKRDRFVEEWIAPAMAKAQLDAPPQIEEMDVFATLPGPIRTAV